ncbi:aminotransferase class III-fold pyridoxal phosphate-dependent enzyme [Streptomyces sp. ME02-8801-2C]|uniref:aminotransferase class III-fold pyridoxal phosphate-dependent enzyme n=1 Tax=Streptomyces sp. ME02-8801-2C TaxID=3028680 RepID=UPI0029A397B0|nr:aminotransferase class III-fold pyridoxal phosphate-dependent enzyme [Streptomyces sp. ME02-8801-2C]MDX3457444.1 aminotransferase class III-fold pyridoxal phosphate-dependent enzyme [Streptomyces sp. ME02-8801-2C]
MGERDSLGSRRLSGLDESGALGEPYVLVDADNATLVLRGTDGRVRTCSDFMSAYASVNFGHRNPYVEEVLSQGSDISALFYPEEAESLSRRLCAAVGGERRVLYQVGGSFAVSTAFALARRHRPGRILAIEGAFHGLGLDALAATTVQRDIALQDTGLSALLSAQIEHLPVGSLPETWQDVSAVVYEPVQGANGYVPLDTDWLVELEAAARKNGVLTISDEIQCGFHRHGSLSPSRAWGLTPDIVLFGKSLTNGAYPLSAVVYRSELENSVAGRVHLAHTFQTATLGFRAGLRVFGFLDSNPVADMGERVAELFRDRAEKWSADGLVRELHVTGPALSFEPTTVAGPEAVRSAFDDGVLMLQGGVRGQRIRIAPPLTTPLEQITEGLDVVGGVLAGSRA